ncbi:Lrp/AsnC family transcriptional regulator [Natrinema gelatinilyticum]|uniref:Lrp/AsnC family transcriptional regulator n=1 Tax=Natrinema gelatinilyticum TaxID=2961571 RepID=UPI0020C2397E|nr:winged helix-turn-helix transcriptional regulator [Natrinema gelatinilyticum]
MDDDSTPERQADDDAETDAEVTLDEVDREVLYSLQRDARNITIQEIADEVAVSASTVRNRIDKLEDTSVIEGYAPQINYERAGFPLTLLFVCTADPDSRSTIAREILAVDGVIDVIEMVTGERNLYVQAVATTTKDLTRTTRALNEYGITIHSSEIITNHYVQPWSHFKRSPSE